MYDEFISKRLEEFLADNRIEGAPVIFVGAPEAIADGVSAAISRIAPPCQTFPVEASSEEPITKNGSSSYRARAPLPRLLSAWNGLVKPRLIGIATHPAYRLRAALEAHLANSGVDWSDPASQQLAATLIEAPENRNVDCRWLIGEEIAPLDGANNMDVDVAAITAALDTHYTYVGSVETLPMSVNMMALLNGQNVMPRPDERPQRSLPPLPREVTTLISHNNKADLALFNIIQQRQEMQREAWKRMRASHLKRKRVGTDSNAHIATVAEKSPETRPTRADLEEQTATFRATLPDAENLNDAIGTALDAVERVNRNTAPAKAFRARIDDPAMDVGVAAQHLRNLFLAYSNGKLFRQMDRIPGLRGTSRPALAALAEYLDAHMLPLLCGQKKDQKSLPAFTNSLPKSPDLPETELEAPAGSPRRILIVLDYLPGNDWMGAHARQICSYAAALAGRADVTAVRVLITQETAPENPHLSNGEVGTEQEKGWRATLNDMAGAAAAKVEFQTPHRSGPVRPHNEAMRLAMEFAPDAVLAFQGMYRSRLVAEAVARFVRRCIAIQFNQYNPEPPFADIVLAHSFQPDFNDKPTPEKWRNHPIPLVPFSRHTEVDTEDLCPDAETRIVTALSQGRLEKGLLADDATDLKRLVLFLQNHPKLAWIGIGMLDPDDLRSRAEAICPEMRDLGNRIICMSAVSDLRAIYRHCAAYVHLPGLHGGAMGVAMAIEEGIPALVRAGTDSANFIDRDLTYHDADTAFRRMEVLVTDPSFRRHLQRRQKDRLRKQHAIPATGRILRGFLDELPTR